MSLFNEDNFEAKASSSKRTRVDPQGKELENVLKELEDAKQVEIKSSTNVNDNTIKNLFEHKTYFQLIIQFINLHGIFHGLFRLNKFALKFLTSSDNQIIFRNLFINEFGNFTPYTNNFTISKQLYHLSKKSIEIDNTTKYWKILRKFNYLNKKQIVLTNNIKDINPIKNEFTMFGTGGIIFEISKPKSIEIEIKNIFHPRCLIAVCITPVNNLISPYQLHMLKYHKGYQKMGITAGIGSQMILGNQSNCVQFWIARDGIQFEIVVGGEIIPPVDKSRRPKLVKNFTIGLNKNNISLTFNDLLIPLIIDKNYMNVYNSFNVCIECCTAINLHNEIYFYNNLRGYFKYYNNYQNKISVNVVN